MDKIMDRTALDAPPPPPEAQESMWSMLAFAWRRKGLVVLSLIIGLVAGYLYFLKQVPLYRSGAQILIVEQRPKLPIPGIDVGRSSSEKHQKLITSEVVIRNAVAIGKLDQLPTFRNSGNAIGAIMGGLSASMEGTANSEILNLSFTSTNPDDCRAVVEAVIAGYKKFLGDTYQNVSKETEELIREAKDQLDSQLSAKEAEYRKFRENSPLLFSGDKSENIHMARLRSVEAARSSKALEISQLASKIEALAKARTDGVSRDALNLMIGRIEESRIGSQLAGPGGTADLFAMDLERQMLLERYGVDHPKVQAVNKRIEITKQHLNDLAAKLESSRTNPNRDFFETYLESLQEQIKLNQQTIDGLTQLFNAELEASKSLSSYQVAEETFRSEIDRKSRLFDVVLQRLEEIRLVTDQQGADIQVLHSPGPGGKILAELKSTLMYSGVLALMCGMGLDFVVDSSDRRFRTPDEIRTQLGVPVVAHIPVIPEESKKQKKASDDDESIRHELRTITSPRGRIAEAYRAVRTAIYFNIRGRGHQVIQITSPNPGDGKTTLAANLAVSIAQSGKKVLLIDADFRRPRCHRLFQVPNEVGICSVMDGTTEWTEAIQESPVANLSLLTCGKRPENPSELLTSRRFEELLALFRERFDLVIVDTPPVLVVTDPLNVAPRVDGVLVVLRLTKSARNAGVRTLANLDEVGANVLGIVVNGVAAGQAYGSYGYSQYHYSYGPYNSDYGNGYGYRYGYGYGYGDDKTYYSDDKEESKKS